MYIVIYNYNTYNTIIINNYNYDYLQSWSGPTESFHVFPQNVVIISHKVFDILYRKILPREHV